MPQDFDVIVIGAGIMGSATCWHLAKRGLRVLCLEQFGVPNSLGASHGLTRAIRMAYFEHPDYIPLLQRTYELWNQLEQATHRTILHITGGLYLGRNSSELVDGSLRSSELYGLPFEMLDQAALVVRYPQFATPVDFVGFYEPNAGVLLPELAVSLMTQSALLSGAVFHAYEPVTGWSTDSESAVVTTQVGRYSAKKLIVCGGAWSGQILSDLSIPLTITRQVMGWVWPNDPTLFQLGTFPIWAMEMPDSSFYYGLPMMPDFPGLKVASHKAGKIVLAEDLDRNATPDDANTFMPFIEEFMPAAAGPVLNMRVCTYTNTPDGHFIIDKHPLHSNVIIAAGFSGHGFKVGGVVGEILADLAEFGKTSLPIEFLAINRFNA
jgi:sarcosine oxidase